LSNSNKNPTKKPLVEYFIQEIEVFKFIMHLIALIANNYISIENDDLIGCY
jgi:hypothetical protein